MRYGYGYGCCGCCERLRAVTGCECHGCHERVTGPTGNAGTGRSGMRVLDEAARSGMWAPAESMGNTMAG